MKFVRADGNETIGMGHIMRCEAFAGEWWKKTEVCFLLADEKAVPEVRSRGFSYHVLHSDYRKMDEELPALEAFLAERDETEERPEILVDSYFVTKAYLTQLRRLFRVTLVDDTKSAVYPCDCLLNYGIYAEELGYRKDYRKEYPDTEFMLGPSYAPVRPEFKNVARITIKEKISNILVTTGGGDMCHFELALAERLKERYGMPAGASAQRNGQWKEMTWHFVIGPMSEDREALETFCGQNPELPIRLHTNVTDMAALMQEMDCAVAASGGTLFELCRLGVPTIAYMVAENQRRNLEAFSDKAGIINAGNFAENREEVLTCILEKLALLGPKKTRKKMGGRMNAVLKVQKKQHPAAVFFTTAIALLLAVALLVIAVDPFFHYHAPLAGFPYIVDNQLSQNPGMAENMLYDSCIIGSSMTVNFHTTDFADILGLDTIKLSYSGAMPKDDSNILSFIYKEDSTARKNSDVKAVFMALDPQVMTADTDATKYDLPEYLYDEDPLNDVSYLFNKDVLFEYILKPVIQRQATDLSTVYASWWTPEYYNEQWVMHNYTAPEKVEEETAEDAFLERTKTNLDTNILPYIEAHPETTFYIFLPPYSVLYWYDAEQENHLDATMAQIAYIGETLMNYDNVRLFDFMTEEDIVTDINNYADIIHYTPETNTYMVECFKDGTDEVAKGGMKEEMDRVRKIIDAYDYDALFARNP